MDKHILKFAILFLGLALVSCTKQLVKLTKENLHVVNREIVEIDEYKHTVILNNMVGDGLAIIEGLNFAVGSVELELKGENIMQKSFLGFAFNIQNDSTYEAVYFRPFNFQSEEKIRRAHSIQYIYHPKFNWSFLRNNFKGQYEAEFPRSPSPDDWFKILIKIDNKKVTVYDKESNTELLTVERLAEQVSDKIAFWTGEDSKGAFRNLKIMK